jgi:hypothetical protein
MVGIFERAQRDDRARMATLARPRPTAATQRPATQPQPHAGYEEVYALPARSPAMATGRPRTGPAAARSPYAAPPTRLPVLG